MYRGWLWLEGGRVVEGMVESVFIYNERLMGRCVGLGLFSYNYSHMVCTKMMLRARFCFLIWLIQHCDFFL